MRKTALTRWQLTKAPLVLERLATLEILDLQSNQLTTLPDELYMGCTSLRYLHLTGNLFVNFSPAITNLKRLELLWAGSNKLDFLPVEMHRVPHSLPFLSLSSLSPSPPFFFLSSSLPLLSL
jgi:Leucine-rich repeat (LRR) protein